MSAALRVVLLGFHALDRAAIAAALRLSPGRPPGYVLVAGLDDGDYVLADADHAPAVQLVLATERLADTVFVGREPPPGALVCMPRPIDPRQLVRELDALRSERLARQAGALPPAEAPQPGAAAPTALVVDDSETARRAMALRLQRRGFVVELAASSGQALGWLARRNFDGLFIDVDLGPASVLDGFGLCQQLKRQPRPGAGPPPWVALVTALDGPSDRVRGTLAGCDAYLAKPVDEAELGQLLWRQGWVEAPLAG